MFLLNSNTLTRLVKGFLGVNAKPTIDIYNGPMPVVDDSFVWNVASYASSLLVRFPANTGIVTGVHPGILQISSNWNPVNATATGTAAWFAMYIGNKAIIGDITDQGPQIAPLYINSVNIASGSPVSLIQLSIKLNN